MTGNPELRIVRYYEEHAAATGEGTRYETDDGRIWRDVQLFERANGYKVGEVIVPRFGQ